MFHQQVSIIVTHKTTVTRQAAPCCGLTDAECYSVWRVRVVIKVNCSVLRRIRVDIASRR